jgi:apolipoprotein N-acyltransferase
VCSFNDAAKLWHQSLLGRIAVALIGGALSVLTLPPFSLIFLTPIVWSALLVSLTALPPRAGALVGLAFGLSHFAFGLSWISQSFYVDAERFGALAVPAVAGLSTLLAIFPAVACGAFALLSRHVGTGVFSAVLLSSLWTGGEWLRGHLLTGFPWNLSGYAVTDYSPFRQTAAWIGSYGMSFLIVLIGSLPGAALLLRGSARLTAIAASLALPAFLALLGLFRVHFTEAPATGVNIRVVQGNFPQDEKWTSGARERALERYVSLTAAGNKAQVVLWPETAFPGYLSEDATARARISAALSPGALLMTGAPGRIEHNQNTRYYNMIQIYDSFGTLLASYAKHHLVPFGEYMPLPNWLPLSRLVDAAADFSAGSGPSTIILPGVPPVAPVICYEIIFPGHIIVPDSRPAWIFNATNDAWFGMSMGPKQHLASAQMRAVEEGLPVVRAANTGISAIIDANGQILAKLDPGVTGFLEAELPSAMPRTPYSRWGDSLLAALLALCWTTWALRRCLRRSTSRC